jgi:hypothetical protein
MVQAGLLSVAISRIGSFPLFLIGSVTFFRAGPHLCRKGLQMKLDDDGNSPISGTNPVGLRSQVGGGLAIFIGFLLYVFYPNVPADAAINLHQMAGLFIGIGAFVLVIGTVARIFFLD